MARPIWSCTSAPSLTVCATAVNATVSGLTATTVGAGPTTVIVEPPVISDTVAVIAALPSVTDSTRPAPSTTATKVSPLAQTNSVPATACPFASVASATKRIVSPNATSVSDGGDTATAATAWAIETPALPDASPAVAVTVAAPLATAVTDPAEFTVATSAALLAHVSAAPGISCPFWSCTRAVSCTVAPSASSSAFAGVTATIVGRGVGPDGTGGGAVAVSPQRTNHAAEATAATTPRVG